MAFPTPRAFLPLRHATFRTLWLATLASNIGMWVQNTGAGWLMTSLDPSPMMVSLVQAASMLPVFLLALPSGALADIVDRRLFLLGAQAWILLMALILAALTATGELGPWGLLALTFAIGAGSAMNFPAWAATTNELVPREDLVGAIALNGIGFNLARALGPALGGFAIAAAGPEAAFALNAVAFLVLIVALLFWRRPPEPRGRSPKERLVPAMRAGLRFVQGSPAMQAAILRACTFFLFSAAVWGLLPLLVRQRLGLGPEAFGLMLGVMGGSAVAAGFALPALRARLDRSATVLWASLAICLAMAILAAATHWLPAALGMLIYGAAWISAGSTLSASAQLAAPGWVRARAIAIYQLSFFGVMAGGSALAGWVGGRFGVPWALGAAAAGGAVAAILVRGWRIDAVASASPEASPARPPTPEAPAAELQALLGERSGRVLEEVRYCIDPAERAPFLAAMQEVRRVRLRSGAVSWRLYEDVAHPERWVELWAVESWTEHLREEARRTDWDRAALARAAAFHRVDGPPEASRFINVVP
ncbi:MFS transporter [Paracraurococcus ruber]|uniref:MFS transporter n=1 Tax=Paracraurococcus ruber TaxID=77675 RepID=A0ABS1D5P4_9PROT|nr:MFS transporter [Paracraurococcus ruber]MBK1661806.1 MFS transporter [Paracraurococcus ruber]TDG31594.1 MFS transporter [Paracraurococcus ruber]